MLAGPPTGALRPPVAIGELHEDDFQETFGPSTSPNKSFRSGGGGWSFPAVQADEAQYSGWGIPSSASHYSTREDENAPEARRWADEPRSHGWGLPDDLDAAPLRAPRSSARKALQAPPSPAIHGQVDAMPPSPADRRVRLQAQAQPADQAQNSLAPLPARRLVTRYAQPAVSVPAAAPTAAPAAAPAAVLAAPAAAPAICRLPAAGAAGPAPIVAPSAGSSAVPMNIQAWRHGYI
ncbi:unnamed protein product [Symbiodinium natans]|uniref:Uncharacterized protein n=1 Tax=Symbiodinium natans TaxID=878477 RepID=A0A812N7C6_9DINO|nr:unnamed protein product [Symbiodinium natans]